MSMDANEPPPAVSQPPGEIAVALAEIRAAAAFLTRLPAGIVGVDPTVAPNFTHGARVFPLVGALIGLAGAIVLIVANAIGMPAFVAAALAVATVVIVTGAFHEDGLADMADSFGGSTTDERLAIMDDSRIGTYGAVAIVMSLLIRVLAIGSIAATGAFRAAFALIAAEAVSRTALVRLWHDLPAARMGGLSSETGAPDQNAMLVALAIAAVLAIALGVPSIGLWATVVASALAAIATFAMIRVTARSIGGRTGDTLGACQQAALIAFLVGASVT